MKTLILIIFTFLFSCNQIQENKQKQTSNNIALEIGDTPASKERITNRQLEIIVNNENYKAKLKKIKFEEKDIPTNIDLYTCDKIIPDYYLLLKDNRLIVVSEQVCGDFGGISLTSIKENKVLQILAVSGQHYEPDNEVEYKVITSFTIDNNYNIFVTDVTTEYEKITNKKITTYSISSTGEFIKIKEEEIKKNPLLLGSTVYAQVDTYLNVRSTPNSNGAIIEKAYPKDELKILEILEAWVKIELNGKQGYVSKDFVR
ncbi:SH3 domain-containing protein [Cellulophaga sp. E16_2]|uniref:SH3 domain-containing protein n=1 Tax=Cellulophaga sp. E16_2 TaxID=2789297 RepID=UPI001A90CC70|nr:SH3 domain-containing protein [Cellulophaga sp. E16_2]MBO0591454.1 SH3 domain-containing protein [Cellulophaga sp. E16_2]